MWNRETAGKKKINGSSTKGEKGLTGGKGKTLRKQGRRKGEASSTMSFTDRGDEHIINLTRAGIGKKQREKFTQKKDNTDIMGEEPFNCGNNTESRSQGDGEREHRVHGD